MQGGFIHSLAEIHEEIERLTKRRGELLRALGDAHDAALVAEHKTLEAGIAQLWQQQRIARARLRFGDREAIIRRARTEQRLERAA
jgi:hypothetical protein